jgi:hypothetical protein
VLPYAVGQEVEAYCSKCQIVLPHQIAKLTGSRISRVTCSTCQDAHAYRKSSPKLPTNATPAQKQAMEDRRRAQAAASYEVVMQSFETAQAQPYTIRSTFEANDFIEHKTFGTGRVLRTLAGNKVEVMFKEGAKILVHGVT